MCEYCGCRGNDAIGELMAEHDALKDDADRVRTALSTGDRDTARTAVIDLVRHLESHVRREERGIFAALRSQGEFADEVSALEAEHRHFDTAIDELSPDGTEFDVQVRALLDELDRHIEREDLGIFPVSVVTLGASGWALVDQAHAETPTFLDVPAPS